MIRIFATADYNFIDYRKLSLIGSLVFIVPGLLLLAIQGLNFSIEFTGGTLVQIETTGVSIGEIRSALSANGVSNAQIQTFGSEGAFVIRARLDDDRTATGGTQETAAVIRSVLTDELGADAVTIERTEAVGPKVGGELRQKAILAILASFGAVLIYLAMRFEWRFGLPSH